MYIRAIKTESDYQAALVEIAHLMDAEPNTPESDQLDVLTTLVEAYEQKHYPIEDPDPVEAILHRMDALGISRKDLETIIGSRVRVSEILARKRPLTLPVIRLIHKSLRIPADILIQTYPLKESRT